MPAAFDAQFELALAAVEHVARRAATRPPGDYTWIFDPSTRTAVPEPERVVLRGAVEQLCRHDASHLTSALAQFARTDVPHTAATAAEALAALLHQTGQALRPRSSHTPTNATTTPTTTTITTVAGLRHLVARVSSEVYAMLPRGLGGADSAVLPWLQRRLNLATRAARRVGLAAEALRVAAQ